MGNAQKALVMAAGIFLAIALITIAVVMFISAQDATKTAQANFSDIQTQLSETAFTVYDHTTVSGSQVVNAVRQFQDQKYFGVEVDTGKNQTNNTPALWYINTMNSTTGAVVGAATGSLSNLTDESNDSYVNPSGKFSATLIVDKSNVVRGIIFQQTN